jgi:hypothetical protein
MGVFPNEDATERPLRESHRQGKWSWKLYGLIPCKQSHQPQASDCVAGRSQQNLSIAARSSPSIRSTPQVSGVWIRCDHGVGFCVDRIIASRIPTSKRDVSFFLAQVVVLAER